MPKFSVVITVYNKGSFIKETIESVLQQSIQDFDIIIVNDGSTDGSDAIIKSIASEKITYLPLAENVGAGAARNIGIKSARGSFIALLDGDDLWALSYLAEITALINLYPEHYVFATAVLKEYKNHTRPNSYSFENPDNSPFLDLDYFTSSYKNTLLTSSSTVLHRSVCENIGYFNENIKSGQDTDLWIRIGLQYRIAFSTKACATYRYAPQSLYKGTRSVKDRPDYLAYLEEEKTNHGLKKFIDLNRYSLIIRARLWGQEKEVNTYLEHLDINNLNSKQRFLLSLPTYALRLAFKSQSLLERAGLKLSAF